MINQLSYKNLQQYLGQSTSIAPLVVFRIIFGLLMLFSTARYVWLGWVDTQLVEPSLHFYYYGFEWVKPLSREGMYAIFGIMAMSCLGIILGMFYRLSTVVFFLCFTYVELIDITYYLNHYYFVSIVAFLLIFVPAHRNFSMDVARNPTIVLHQIPRWIIDIFKLQIAIVYIYAGLAKINSDWLFEALPLSIWLPAKTGIPVIGPIFQYKFTAYLFSWIGMLFDTFIVFGLLYRKTRWISYIAVVIFHTLTGILFQIGVFPMVMIFAVTIFFSPTFHEKIIQVLGKPFRVNVTVEREEISASKLYEPRYRWLPKLLIPFFIFQALFPWRYLTYPGNLFWTEEGYRFSWRVMLMEKAGTATFYVQDGQNGRKGAVINHQFLNSHQEKQMAMQPDLILQFAHYLKGHFQTQGLADPVVTAEVWVTLNARPAQLLIDPKADLTRLEDTWRHKSWINPFLEK